MIFEYDFKCTGIIEPNGNVMLIDGTWLIGAPVGVVCAAMVSPSGDGIMRKAARSMPKSSLLSLKFISVGVDDDSAA